MKNDVILEAEMVALSDTAGRIDGEQCPCFFVPYYVKPSFRVLKNSLPR